MRKFISMFLLFVIGCKAAENQFFSIPYITREDSKFCFTFPLSIRYTPEVFRFESCLDLPNSFSQTFGMPNCIMNYKNEIIVKFIYSADEDKFKKFKISDFEKKVLNNRPINQCLKHFKICSSTEVYEKHYIDGYKFHCPSNYFINNINNEFEKHSLNNN